MTDVPESAVRARDPDAADAPAPGAAAEAARRRSGRRRGAGGTASSARQRLYLVAMLIDTIGSGLWMPIGLIFFVRAQHLPVEQVGAALTIGGAFGLLAGPLGGNLVDRWGPGRFILVSNVARAMVFVLYPLTDSLWQVSLLAAGFAASDRLFWTANAPLLSDMAPGRALDGLLGTQNVIRIVGLGVGAGLSGAFAGSVRGLHLLAYLNAASYALAAAVIVFAVDLSTRAVATGAPGPGTSGERVGGRRSPTAPTWGCVSSRPCSPSRP